MKRFIVPLVFLTTWSFQKFFEVLTYLIHTLGKAFIVFLYHLIGKTRECLDILSGKKTRNFILDVLRQNLPTQQGTRKSTTEANMADESADKTHTESQIYLSTRGGDYGVRSPSALHLVGGLLTTLSSRSRRWFSKDSQRMEAFSCPMKSHLPPIGCVS